MAINVFPVPSSAAVTPTGWTAGVAGTFLLSNTLSVGTYLIKTDSTQSMTITLVDSAGHKYAGTVRGGSGFITVATAVNQIVIPGSLTYPFGIEITPVSVTQLAAPTSLSISFVGNTGVVTGTWGTAPTGATGAVLFTPTGDVVNFSSTASGATVTLTTSQYNINVTNELVVAFKNSSGAIGIGSTFSLSMAEPAVLEYLVVAGGGGACVASGAGAGGFRTATGFAIPASFTVTVGAGGAAGTTGSSGQRNLGTAGSDSVFSTITSTGGARGTSVDGVGNSGGSGSGGASTNASGGGTGGAGNTPSTSPSQGNAGGNGTSLSSQNQSIGGGGGGAGAAGGTGGSAASSPGAGGSGTASSISGSSVTYAGGGGGSSVGQQGTFIGAGGAGGGGSGASNGDGTVNTGGGGGAGSTASSTTKGAGGSGVVILSQGSALPDFTSIGAGLTYTKTTSGGKTIYRFTAGTGTVTL